MASDYQAISRDNKRRYGTDIGRIGHLLLADRYDDRTHFIYELLQNAEDALVKRGPEAGKRSVCFSLGESELRVSHFGLPFDEADVRGICGIAESTKDLTEIGRFGIGFKSVYAFSDRPEIYSGDESFAIESFVWPVAVAEIKRQADETLVVLPSLQPSDRAEIENGLRRLGAGSLLFLRAIEEIEWRVENGPSGLYLRSAPEWLADNVRRVSVMGQADECPDVEESWLVFSREVIKDGKAVGYVEVAFSLVDGAKAATRRVRAMPRSPLVVFFPTVLETRLGFLLQGPYRTTPSRDNVPANDAWNRHCVIETANLLREALHWLRNNELLDVGALCCLPLKRANFPETAMFAPIFDVVKEALLNEELLPRHDGGYVAGRRARLARTQELRDLFTPAQVTALVAADYELAWLSGDISQDRTPELREYLLEELSIEEERPETVMARLDAEFLSAQPDEWVRRLYEFLGGQRALHPKAKELPIIRLADGTHVKVQVVRRQQAFLPGTVTTDFPTVRRAVCDTEEARSFLLALGLTEPDAVDDVIRNVLPKYTAKDFDAGEGDYSADIGRILTAFGTDSKQQREKLINALRVTPFVMAVAHGAEASKASRPCQVYIATDRLKQLFSDVPRVRLVDDRFSCLRGEDLRELLEACGAVRYLRPITDTSLRWDSDELERLREEAGHASSSGYNDDVTDYKLFGLKALLASLPALGPEERRKKSGLIWEELAHLEERRGKGVFTAVYTWTHYGSYRAACDAAFIRELNNRQWVPDERGNLERPDAVLFDSLGWKPHAFLLSKIRFKPPIIDQLAKEAGIEPGVLDLLRMLGVTSEADLRARLGVEDDEAAASSDSEADVQSALEKLLGGAAEPTAPVPDPAGQDPVLTDNGGTSTGQRAGARSGGKAKPSGGVRGDRHMQGTGPRPTGSKRTPSSDGGRPFISYVGTHAEDGEPDPDGLEQAERMALEVKAIEFIMSHEAGWQRTAIHNPGFDLFEGPNEEPFRLCEVKAMTGSLKDRPVGLTRTQFDCARAHGDTYWLYIVEQAGTACPRLIRIQDPVGRARTFTFDRGWLSIAEVNPEEKDRED